VVLVALVACGDQLPPLQGIDVESGARLKARWTFYADGSREPELGGTFYDAELHTDCTLDTWGDGLRRCIPTAQEALFTNAECTELIGASDGIDKPGFFILREVVGGFTKQTHIYYAGAPTTRPTTVYQRVDGVCTGAQSAPFDFTYFAIAGEAGIAAVTDGELVIDDERISLFTRESEDGMFMPRGPFDRTLDASCTATRRPEGIVCGPDVGQTFYFRDPACALPATSVRAGFAPPRVRLHGSFDDCPQYLAVGAEIAGPLYQRTSTGCIVRGIPAGDRIFALDGPGDVQRLQRRVETKAGVRLQRIVLAAGETRFYDERMFDTALQTECTGELVDDAVRCVPRVSAQPRTFFTAGCAAEVHVAERSRLQCEQPSYLRAFIDSRLVFYPLAEPVTTPLFSLDSGACAPADIPATIEILTLGAPKQITDFVGGHVAAER